jgi:hypothetical protein
MWLVSLSVGRQVNGWKMKHVGEILLRLSLLSDRMCITWRSVDSLECHVVSIIQVSKVVHICKSNSSSTSPAITSSFKFNTCHLSTYLQPQYCTNLRCCTNFTQITPELSPYASWPHGLTLSQVIIAPWCNQTSRRNQTSPVQSDFPVPLPPLPETMIVIEIV